jgi:hypothetical protein
MEGNEREAEKFDRRDAVDHKIFWSLIDYSLLALLAGLGESDGDGLFSTLHLPSLAATRRNFGK